MAAASPVPSPIPSATGGEKRIIAYLRELREEVQNLQEAVQKVKAASELTDPQASVAVLEAALEGKEKFDRNADGIEKRLFAIQDVFGGNEDLHAQYGDAITEINNRWDSIKAHWPKGNEGRSWRRDSTKSVTTWCGSSICAHC